MNRIGIDIMGISEMKWMGMGHFRSGEAMIYYSGNDSNRKNGVAFLCSQKFSQFVNRYSPVSDRFISMRLQGRTNNLTIIQIYAPTSLAIDEEMNEFYSSLQELVDNTLKTDILIIMGMPILRLANSTLRM